MRQINQKSNQGVKMLVCECLDLEYDDIKKALDEHPRELTDVFEAVEAIKESIEAGEICGCCIEDECDKVDMLLKDAVAKALKELTI